MEQSILACIIPDLRGRWCDRGKCREGGKMGGVQSAGAVAFSPKEGRTVQEISKAMLRASVMGGVTLFFVNALRCSPALGPLKISDLI